MCISARWYADSGQELRKIEDFIEVANKETFNPVGLNVLSPRRVALLFVSPRRGSVLSSTGR